MRPLPLIHMSRIIRYTSGLLISVTLDQSNFVNLHVEGNCEKVVTMWYQVCKQKHFCNCKPVNIIGNFISSI